MPPLTMPDVALAAALLSLGGVLWTNRGNLPLRRAQRRQAEAEAESAAVQAMRTALQTVQEDNTALHGELAALRDRLGVISRWVAGLPSHLVPEHVRAALRDEAPRIPAGAPAGDD